ncbi:MAG: hypothetical protein ACM359_18815 [Bacillota bacterium]
MEESAQLVLGGNPSAGNAPTSPRRIHLGEELPIFCEHCGYALHGLPPVRCEHCQTLHFRCPECGHTQPINTLRPAVQRMLGRVQAWITGLWVLVKINFFFWLLFAWLAMGVEWSYRYTMSGKAFTIEPYPIDFESILAFSFFGLSFGMVARMLLLRWRRSLWVGMILASLVSLAILGGAIFYQWERQIATSPLRTGFIMMIILADGFLILGTIMVFPIWSGFVRLFLPKHTASALLDWQMGQPESMCSLNAPKPD